MPKQESEQRAELISAAITELQAQKSEIEAAGTVAPPGCYVARYQAKGQKHHYWYYQLKAQRAIFPKSQKENEYSRYQHLGKAGSSAHINKVKLSFRPFLLNLGSSEVFLKARPQASLSCRKAN